MYHIKITKDTQVKSLTHREWKVISKKKVEGEETPEEERGYTPQVSQKEMILVTVLEQSVEDLDLPKVIAAVNGLTLRKPRGD